MDDDSSDEKKVEQPPVVVPLAVPKFEKVKLETRSWNMNDGRPAHVREWNVDTSSVHRRKRGSLFSRYAFRDEEKSKKSIPREYAFQDESPPNETQKPTSPIVPITPPYYGEPPILHDVVAQLKMNTEDTSKKSEVSPSSPTLAERVKIAMENKELQPKKTFNMDSFIPMQPISNNNLVSIKSE